MPKEVPVVEEKQEDIRDYKGKSRVIKKYKSPLGTNCVSYVKSKKAVPAGLSTLSQKISKIRTHTPQKGLVGVTREGWVGHMVFVEEVKEKTVIISEGNYRHGFITFREVPKSLIMGYL